MLLLSLNKLLEINITVSSLNLLEIFSIRFLHFSASFVSRFLHRLTSLNNANEQFTIPRLVGFKLLT